MRTLIVDTETTGLKDPEVVEYGAMEVTLASIGTYPFGDVQHSRHRPSKPIEFGAIATHGILDEDVAQCEPFSLSAVAFDCEYLIGQNIDYDWAAMGKPDVKRIDTLALARKVWPALDSHKLMALVAYLDRGLFRQLFASAHSVVTDIQATAYVLARLVAELKPLDMEDLYRMSEDARIYEIMPIGKEWKGKPVWQVDNGFRDWCRRQPDMDPYLLKAFDKYPYRRA